MIIKEQLTRMREVLPPLEAEMLLAHVLQVTRNYLYTYPEMPLSSEILPSLLLLIKRRQNGEPIAYIIGKKEFWSLNLTVNANVLIPRPETESLVACVIQQRGGQLSQKIADLGTGSGAIALALASERPTWQIYATDKSFAALQVAEQNAKDCQLFNVKFYQGDWFCALPCQDFDVIVSNPPYIAEDEWLQYAEGLSYEPSMALLAGKDGLDAIRHLIYESKNYLKPNGCLFIEHGFMQAQAVRQLFEKNSYQVIESVKDLAGHERITWGSLSSFL